MWKIFLGFVVFAGLGLFMIFKGGDKVDMSGEKHDTGSHTAAPAAPSAAPPVVAPTAPAVMSAASSAVPVAAASASSAAK